MTPLPEHLREHGFDPGAPLMRACWRAGRRTARFPAAPVAASGGFVISEHPLHTLVPVENAAMDDRTIIQWDKDDLDVLGLLKVDCLALGMLTCVRKTSTCCAPAGGATRRRRHPAGRRRHLRDDPARRHGRRVPDRIARADGDAAAAEAGVCSTTW
jgi:hypothetical protein